MSESDTIRQKARLKHDGWVRFHLFSRTLASVSPYVDRLPSRWRIHLMRHSKRPFDRRMIPLAGETMRPMDGLRGWKPKMQVRRNIGLHSPEEGHNGFRSSQSIAIRVYTYTWPEWSMCIIHYSRDLCNAPADSGKSICKATNHTDLRIYVVLRRQPIESRS